MDGNILLLETDSEIITLFKTALGELIPLDRKPRPKDMPPPSAAPMVIGGQTIYSMEFYAVPSVTEEMARKQSKRARQFITEFKSRTSGVTKRPSMHQILIDRKMMMRLHEVLEKDESGQWKTVHHHWEPIGKK
jgi:hypothetical protein